MANLKGIISRVTGGGGAARGRGTGGTGGVGGGLGGTRGTAGPGGAAGGRRSQDEAIGRGVRSLLSRFRR